jgi:hypothetical protein
MERKLAMAERALADLDAWKVSRGAPVPVPSAALLPPSADPVRAVGLAHTPQCSPGGE